MFWVDALVWSAVLFQSVVLTGLVNFLWLCRTAGRTSLQSEACLELALEHRAFGHVCRDVYLDVRNQSAELRAGQYLQQYFAGRRGGVSGDTASLILVQIVQRRRHGEYAVKCKLRYTNLEGR